MFDIKYKFFAPDGSESGKTDLLEEEKDDLEKDVEDKTETEESNSEKDNTDLELKKGNDLSFEDLEQNDKILKDRIFNQKPVEKQEEEKTDDDKTKSDEELLYDPNKGEADQPDKTIVPDKTDAPVKITKEYIASQPKEHQDILQRISGETISPKALKSYIHSQVYIDQLKSGELKQPDKPIPEKQEVLSVDEINAERKAFLINKLKSSYPDLTEDVFTNEDSLEEYVSDLKMHSPIKAEKFIKAYFENEGNWNSRIEQYTKIANNWETIAKASVVEAVKTFDAGLKKRNIKSDDIGIKYTEKFMLDTFIMPNGKPNPKIVTYLDSSGRVPIINREALVTVMKEYYEDSIIDAVRNAASNEAMSNRSKREAPGSISTSTIKHRVEREAPIEKFITDEMTLAEAEVVYNKQKEKLLSKKAE